MFKINLQATTAFVVAASLSFLAAQSGAQARPITSHAPRDRNDEFLCTYGQFRVYASQFPNSGGESSYFEYVAVPIAGRGQIVDDITVKEARQDSPQFLVGIYSDTASHIPGNLISGGHGRAPARCANVEVSIAPTKLERGKTYWVEEGVRFFPKRKQAVYWAIAPHTTLRAYEILVSCSNSINCTGNWQEQSAGPYVRLK
jgi:hypothetical protein